MRGVDAAAAGGITNVLLTLPLPLFPARVRLLLADAISTGSFALVVQCCCC